MKIDRDGVTLSTGKHVYAHQRLISIPIIEQADDDPFEFGGGYDGGFAVHSPQTNTEESAGWMLTPSEGIEICDAMILAWRRRRKLLVAMKKKPRREARLSTA